jgi:hypothetical protein
MIQIISILKISCVDELDSFDQGVDVELFITSLRRFDIFKNQGLFV